jgi:hypothetical protein
MNVGELNVHIENNAVRLCLTQDDVGDLEMFNAMLFRQLLKLMKPFMMLDKDNKENSYFVVPTRLGKMTHVCMLWKDICCLRGMSDVIFLLSSSSTYLLAF